MIFLFFEKFIFLEKGSAVDNIDAMRGGTGDKNRLNITYEPDISSIQYLLQRVV